jgi:hypothetical protein
MMATHLPRGVPGFWVVGRACRLPVERSKELPLVVGNVRPGYTYGEGVVLPRNQ